MSIDYPDNPGLATQIAFLVQIDKVKQIFRKSKLFDGSRFENDAEHSWSICVMAVLFRQYAESEVDMERVLTMLLIHDVVEIDAGDTFLYAADRVDAHIKEREAAKRIFGMLEPSQRDEFLEIWEEFEARTTPEAKFASVFDRLEPILQNYLNEGFTWKQHGVTYDMVLERNRHIAEGAPEIWNFVVHLLDSAVSKGFLKR